ncbi:MAG TPA: pseudouridine synthase [Candidatus Sulfotelmatobacter sp.]|nr:pseudouridine synthase [Candidatus Sulfotelmatobacter sp.]
MPQNKSRKIGLARALSKLGYCSRSQASELIRAGRVTLNGTTRRDPECPVQIERDRIAVEGRVIKAAENVYMMMNKPRGLVTTASDEKGRDTVYSLFTDRAESLPWLAPVGRLDKASEGLLLLTNDSEWGARITAPESHLLKTYHVQIASIPPREVLESLERGVRADDGEFLQAVHCRLLRSGRKNCWIEIALDEGKNRQIRRMLAALDIAVLRLLRLSIGPLQLGTLRKGAYRSLTSEEKTALDRAMRQSSGKTLKSDLPT